MKFSLDRSLLHKVRDILSVGTRATIYGMAKLSAESGKVHCVGTDGTMVLEAKFRADVERDGEVVIRFGEAGAGSDVLKAVNATAHSEVVFEHNPTACKLLVDADGATFWWLVPDDEPPTVPSLACEESDVSVDAYSEVLSSILFAASDVAATERRGAQGMGMAGKVHLGVFWPDNDMIKVVGVSGSVMVQYRVPLAASSPVPKKSKNKSFFCALDVQFAKAIASFLSKRSGECRIEFGRVDKSGAASWIRIRDKESDVSVMDEVIGVQCTHSSQKYWDSINSLVENALAEAESMCTIVPHKFEGVIKKLVPAISKDSFVRMKMEPKDGPFEGTTELLISFDTPEYGGSGVSATVDDIGEWTSRNKQPAFYNMDPNLLLRAVRAASVMEAMTMVMRPNEKGIMPDEERSKEAQLVMLGEYNIVLAAPLAPDINERF